MTEREQIKWPYGFTGVPRQMGPVSVPSPRNHTLQDLVAGLSAASETERRDFLTWLRQMLDYYGLDSMTAIERGIEPDPSRRDRSGL